MIQLTRLNRQPIWVNSDLLKFVENTPDSVITLVSGEKIVVLESIDVIVERLVEFRRRVMDGMFFRELTSPQVKPPTRCSAVAGNEGQEPQDKLK